MPKAVHSEIAHADPQACFDAITDFERYPEWVAGMKSCRILERDEQGRGLVVEAVLDLKLRTIRYVNRYSYEEPTHLWWSSIDGDIKRIDGEYRFEDQGDGTTRMTFTLDVDPGMFVPGPIKKMMSEGMAKNSVRDLKARVESG
jgi:ribosome-associated toxin RatA of RatAB toxin-antitoxin module